MLLGVFDGHGGDRVAQYLAEHFSERFVARYASGGDISAVYRDSKRL